MSIFYRFANKFHIILVNYFDYRIEGGKSKMKKFPLGVFEKKNYCSHAMNIRPSFSHAHITPHTYRLELAGLSIFHLANEIFT